jgi:hypothetical protein
MPIDLDDLLNASLPDDTVNCPDCGGQGWNALWTLPPEQVQCERCDGSGGVLAHTLSETEAAAWNDWLADQMVAALDDEEQDDPDGLLDDEDDAASVSA